MCAKFGEDRSISFQVMGKKAKALPTDGQTDGWTGGQTDGQMDRRIDGQTVAIAIPPPNLVCGGGKK